jgi:nucleotide-binding universal stress UspA family protein
MSSRVHFTSALEDFRRARRQASIQALLNQITGKTDELFSYEAVRKQLRAIEGADRKLQDIPLNAILGSVNRYTDFTRSFLPRRSLDAQRWARVKAAADSMIGLPPIEVYQIGEVFFVQDGNHRVSIARQSGNTHIQAYVKEVHTRVPLTPDMQPDDLIIKAEYIDFLDQTHFDQLYPQTDLNTTSPGRFPFILQQIEAIRFSLESQRGIKVLQKEAVTYWHNKIYLPILEIIQERDLLQDFPNRTETDLFIWIIKYKFDLTKELGWEITPDSTTTALVSRFNTQSKHLTSKLRTLFRNQLHGITVGQWRETQLAARQGRLFADVLVVFTGRQNDQYALDLAIYVARMEGSQIFGLFIAPPNKGTPDYRIAYLQSNFDQRCADANVTGKLAIVFERNPVDQIIRRAGFADLVILSLGSRLLNGHRITSLIHHCPTPIITIPGTINIPLKKTMLAYDGSPKANEALFLATYLSKFWEISLAVVTIEGHKTITPKMLIHANEILDHYSIEAELINASGSPAIAVSTFAVEDQIDLIITGGYGANPIKKFVSGSLVDRVIKDTRKPVMICK